LSNAGVAKKIVAFYKQYVNADNIKTEFNLLAGHTFVRSHRNFIVSETRIYLRG